MSCHALLVRRAAAGGCRPAHLVVNFVIRHFRQCEHSRSDSMENDSGEAQTSISRCSYFLKRHDSRQLTPQRHPGHGSSNDAVESERQTQAVTQSSGDGVVRGTVNVRSRSKEKESLEGDHIQQSQVRVFILLGMRTGYSFRPTRRHRYHDRNSLHWRFVDLGSVTLLSRPPGGLRQ